MTSTGLTSTDASRRRRLSPYSNAPVYAIGLALAAVVIAPIAYVDILGILHKPRKPRLASLRSSGKRVFQISAETPKRLWKR